MFGFSSDTIDLQSNIDSIFLKIQYLDMRDIVIQRAGPAGKYFEIKTNKNLVDYSVEPIDVSKTLYHNFGSDHKTIRFYDNIHSSDSIQFKFIAMDSIDNMLIDTLYLKFVESKREKDEFSFTTLPKTKSKITDQFKGSIQFTKPIININFDSLYFKYDSVTYQYINDSIQYELNKRKDLLTFDIELFFSKYIQSLQKSDTAMVNTSEITTGIRRSGGTGSWVSKVMFYIGEGAFISADMDTSKSAVLEYQMLKPQDYGTIKGKVISAYNSFIIQLLKGKKDIIKEVINQKQYEFTNVEPGEYSIRVLIDNNGNGRWEPGNIFKDLEPESVFFFAEEITIRSHWELTDIDLEF